MPKPNIDPAMETRPPGEHYHAEPVRILFFIGAILMLICFPLFSKVISLNIIFIMFGIMLVILAGLTNRRLKTLFFLNAAVSLFIIIVLEIIALNLTFADHPFLVFLNQLLAFIFVVALYYCLRTIRGFLFK